MQGSTRTRTHYGQRTRTHDIIAVRSYGHSVVGLSVVFNYFNNILSKTSNTIGSTGRRNNCCSCRFYQLKCLMQWKPLYIPPWDKSVVFSYFERLPDEQLRTRSCATIVVFYCPRCKKSVRHNQQSVGLTGALLSHTFPCEQDRYLQHLAGNCSSCSASLFYHHTQSMLCCM
jgi:predicted nucleic-acid-binding Zn-ribbon protein